MTEATTTVPEEPGDTPPPSSGGWRRRRFFEWVGTHLRLLVAVIAGLTVLAVPFAAQRQDADEPSFDPSGEIFDVQAEVDDTFESTSDVVDITFVVAAETGDALTRDVLLEWKRNSDRLRAGADASTHLASEFAFDIGVEIDGVWSIADEVDAVLPGGLEGATDADVKGAVAQVVGDDAVGSPVRRTLALAAQATRREIDGEDVTVWAAPAFAGRLLVDGSSFPDAESADEDADFGDLTLDGQEWVRSAQDVLKGDESSYTAWGVGFDGDLTFNEQLEAASPFILLSIIGILFLVGGLLRSYWAAALVALGLGAAMLLYSAVVELAGFDGGMLLGFVVPIATIAFGVDFFVHASGRAREEQVHGHPRDRAYPLGLTAVFPALLLAGMSSVAAFVSNGVSGIEAIVQFGLGAGIALLIAFAILSVVVPKALLAVEDGLGDPPLDRGRTIPNKIGFVVMALVAGAAVTLTVVLPIAGVVLLVVFALLFVALPFWWTRRSYARAAAAGRPTGVQIRGAGHGLRSAGDVVHFLARWRVFTIPVTVVLAVLGVIGFTKVETAFSFSDFFSEDSGFIQGVDLFEENFGAGGGGDDGYVFVEGDLTQPSALSALEQAVADIGEADAAGRGFLQRDVDGTPVTGDDATTIARAAVASETARAEIEATTGVAVTDEDGDGLPDAPAQTKAIFDQAFSRGITTDGGFLAFRPETVPEVIRDNGDGTYATRAIIGIESLTDDRIISDARRALDDAAADLEQGPAAGAFDRVAVSGTTITQKASLDSFTRAMVYALPIAVVLCALLASLFMRSLKYGIAAVIPILLVVGWIYGFMFLAGFKINVVTATIAAIAVGVGIDYSTHFTMRFREEFEGEPSRFPALRRAGEGTGGALAISALSSILGFAVMALAPMPIFATFGTLTAVMIAFSLTVALLVLPSLLLVVTFSRTGEERERLIDLIGLAGEDYDPHARATAARTRQPTT
jgi:predicted RND superfamily exporter protein